VLVALLRGLPTGGAAVLVAVPRRGLPTLASGFGSTTPGVAVGAVLRGLSNLELLVRLETGGAPELPTDLDGPPGATPPSLLLSTDFPVGAV